MAKRNGAEITGKIKRSNAGKRFGGGVRGFTIPESDLDNHWLGIGTSATDAAKDAIKKAYR